MPPGATASTATLGVGALGRERTPAQQWFSEQFTAVIDGVLDVAVASLAWWTVLYGLLLLLLHLPLPAAFGLWLAGTGVIAWARIRHRWYGRPGDPTPWGAAIAGATALALAALSSVISRPDGDDAAFVIRSTWVADHGAVATRDMIFTDGVWPTTFGADPNLSSIETLFGAVARYLGVPVGDVVYRYFVPLATFAAVWAVWLLLRVWRARRPASSLVLTMCFIVLGGYSHATWGNLHLARIWQGKAVLVAVLVPYLYAVLFTAVGHWKGVQGSGRRWLTSAVLVGVGAAGVGASTTAVFLVPLIAAAASVPLWWKRRWLDAIVVVASTSLGPVVAGVITVLSPVGSRNAISGVAQWPWVRVLADGTIATVAVVAVLLVFAGVVMPRWFGSVERDAQAGLAAVLVCGFLFTIPPAYPVLVALMGGDAVAFRLAWTVPVPAVIGLLASLPSRRWALPVLPVTAVALAAILTVGQPLWATSNLAHLGRPGTWKVRAQDDLAAARWVVDQQPGGRYLAPNWVTIMVGVITSELRPVGSRMDFVQSLDSVPGSQVDERVLLQQMADGAESRVDENLEPALRALDDLDVSVACFAWADAFTDDLMGAAGFELGYTQGPWSCWSESTSSRGAS